MTGNELNMRMHRYSNYCGDSLKFISAAEEQKGVIPERAEPKLTPARRKLAGIFFNQYGYETGEAVSVCKRED